MNKEFVKNMLNKFPEIMLAAFSRKQRMVAHYETDNIIIDTCFATDTELFETGIKKYGVWVIVEEYETKKAAQSGHNKWVEKLTGSNPPKEIYDIHIEEYFNLTQ